MALATLKRNIRQLVNGVTIKYSRKAADSETPSIANSFDEYLGAYYETDKFTTYSKYPYKVLKDCPGLIGYCENRASRFGTSVAIELRALASTPSMIPNTIAPSDSLLYKDIYDEILKKHRAYILNNYEELNDYYRTLRGLPPLGGSDVIRIKTSILSEYGIDTTQYNKVNNSVSIHLLSDNDIFILESVGYLNKIREENPNLEYLKHLGVNRVDIVTARQAKNFSILKINKADIPENVYTTFTRIYEQCREYFMSVIYNRNMSAMHDQYDNFIALCIMVMTIQRYVSNTFKFGVQRDLFDWEFIQNMYKSYNVPFIDSLAIDHHVVILKNLNNLLRHKSTDKVLFDICSILGLTYVDIYKYYLVKDQLRDDNGKPIFVYKDKYDEDGNVIGKEIDYKNTYNLYFQAVDIEEDNIILALQDTTDGNRVDYDEMVSGDPYWWEDDELEKLKYSEAFNYVETKYLSLNLMYKMTEMLFEVSYAFRAMLDKKDDIDNNLMSIPKIIPDVKFKIFDIVVFMIALLCKKHGFTGNIISDPGLVAHIYGFDFTAKDTEQYQTLLNSLDTKDPDSKTLKKYLDELNISSDVDISELFDTLRNYNKFMVEKMRSTNDIHTYHLYKDIFNITMTEDNMKELFSYTDGESNTVIATSYLDYLTHKAPMLGGFVSSVEVDDISGHLEHLLSQLDVYVEELQYTYIISGTDSPLIKALISLIRFFKSYTVDISGFNIIYLFDSKMYNLIRMTEYIKHIDARMTLPESTRYQYSDNVHLVSQDECRDILKNREIHKHTQSHITYGDFIKNFKDTYSISLKETVLDSLNSTDDYNTQSNSVEKDKLGFKEKLFIISE